MQLLRDIPVQTPDGGARISLWHGDLTRLPAELAVDMLLVSAFPRNYQPVPGTLIGALHNRGVSVGALAASKEADLRESSGFWLSQPLGDTALNIGRILCFEHAPLGTPTGLVGEIFRNLGPFLPERGARIATSLLATGNQYWPIEMVLPAMIGAAAEWMRRGLEISELMIVEVNQTRAYACAGIMDAMQSIAPGDNAAGDVAATAKAAVSTAIGSRGTAGDDSPLDLEEFRERLRKNFGVRRADPPDTPAKPPAPRKGSAQKVIAPQRPPWVHADGGDGDRPYDVFVSYTTTDREAAEALSAAMREAWPDARIFDYRQEIDQSLFWQQAIDDAIEGCGKVVAVLSPEYFASPECTEEIMIARLRNKRAGGGVLLPVYWRSLEGDLALWLQIINYADCRECDPARLKTFAERLGPGAAAAVAE